MTEEKVKSFLKGSTNLKTRKVDGKEECASL